MTVRKRGEHWYVDISEKGRHRVQRVLKVARTKAQALKAEAKLRTQIFENRQTDVFDVYSGLITTS